MVKKYDKFLIEFANYISISFIPEVSCWPRKLYSTANDPQPQLIPRPQMIPKMDRKWSSTASDPQSRPQMIP